MEESARLRPGSIKQVVLISGETVPFDGVEGGAYDATRKCIVGLDSTGATVTVNTEDVLYLRVETLDADGSFIITLPVVLGLAAISFILLALSHGFQ
ncbi:MAG: hypothetical protein IH600_08465 [Bacteroidetes bacterium]|nr:hypothetical protein [Bacteroidota bacterium]